MLFTPKPLAVLNLRTLRNQDEERSRRDVLMCASFSFQSGDLVSTLSFEEDVNLVVILPPTIICTKLEFSESSSLSSPKKGFPGIFVLHTPKFKGQRYLLRGLRSSYNL